MTHTRLSLAAALLVLLAPGAALAKKDLHDWQNVVDLDVDTKIVVRVVTGQVFFGYPTKVTAEALTLELTLTGAVLPTGSTSFARTIPRSEIAEVRKAKASRWKSALVGAAIGAAIAGGITGVVEASSGPYDDKGAVTIAMAGLGAQVGAVTGAIQPIAFLKGKKVYVAP
jgi:hypothetical protein